MRSATFLAAGVALLLVQANVFRLIDGLRPTVAIALWVVALVVDIVTTARQMREVPGRPRAIATFRAELTLPALVLMGWLLLERWAHTSVGRPIPALVLPLILFMGVHEYPLARGAAVAFVLGYATDVVGIAPIGLYTFTYVATFVLARAAGLRLAAQTTWMQALLVGAFAILQSVMVLVLLAIFGRDPWVPRALYPLVLSHAAATASVAPIVFRISQAIHVATAGAPRTEPTAGAPS